MIYSNDVKRTIQDIFEDDAQCRDTTVQLGLQLTTKCVVGCSYCGADRHDRVAEIDFNLLTSHITNYNDNAKRIGRSLAVGMDGADNFLYSHFDELIQWLYEADIPYFIKSNASTLTKIRAQRLIETGCEYVRFTVCGDQVTHDALRGLDTYDTVCKKTKMATDMGLHVVWNLTVGDANIDSMYKVLQDIPNMGLSGVTENRIYRAGLVNDDSYTELSPQKWREFLLTMLHAWVSFGDEKFPLNFRDTLWVPLLVEEGLLDLSKFPEKGYKLGCGLDTHYACISVDGHVKGCITLEAAAKEVHAPANIIKFYPSNKTTLFHTKDVRFASSSECRKCEYYHYCRGCNAISLANTGNINNQDPQCWVKLSQHNY